MYNRHQRRAFFPFNVVGTVKLISFDVPWMYEGPQTEVEAKATNSVSLQDSVPVITALAPGKYLLNQRKIKEEKTLSGRDIDKLTDIFYNVGLTPVKNLTLEIADPGSKCYEPRNAILFFDANGQLTQYIELCFTCHKYYLSSAKIKYAQNCEQKSDLIKQFFLARGIKYGTVLPKGYGN